MQPTGRDRRSIIDIASQMLWTFSPEEPSLGVTEIARRLQLAKSTAHRVVTSLVENGFLAQTEDGRYQLGSTIFGLAARHTRDSTLTTVSVPHLTRLRDAFGETAMLVVPVGSLRVCVAQVPSRSPILMRVEIGSTLPIVAGAAGKAILSAMGASSAAALVPDEVRLLNGAARPKREYLAELAQVRASGYATSIEEAVKGASSVAVAVVTPSGRVLGAINVTGPKDRWSHAGMIAAVPEIQKAVQAIGRESDNL